MSPNPSANRRATLAPRVPSAYAHVASAFHAALSLFNSERGTDLTWDELTADQQADVRARTRELYQESRPCQRQ